MPSRMNIKTSTWADTQQENETQKKWPNKPEGGAKIRITPGFSSNHKKRI